MKTVSFGLENFLHRCCAVLMPARRGGWCQLDNYSLNSNFCWNVSERLPAAAWLGIVLPHRYPAVGWNRLGYCHHKYFDKMLFHRCYSKHTFCQVLLHESDSLISLCQIFWTSVPSLFDLITCNAEYCGPLQPVAVRRSRDSEDIPHSIGLSVPPQQSTTNDNPDSAQAFSFPSLSKLFRIISISHEKRWIWFSGDEIIQPFACQAVSISCCQTVDVRFVFEQCRQ